MSDAVAQGQVDPRYPVGGFEQPKEVTPHLLMTAIAEIAELPQRLEDALTGLGREQLDTPYREGGWTVRQLVHHVADSHMNAFMRIRMALTEDWPAIVAYDEKAWANLHDSAAPVGWSVELIRNLHARWVMLLQSPDEEQWKRGYKHPERGPVTVEMTALLYAWHSRHHVAHITQLRKREGW